MELLNGQNDHEIDEIPKVEGPLKKITEMEIEVALKGMRERKAAGPTGVTSKLLQATGREAVKDLRNIFIDLWEEKKYQKTGEIAPLHQYIKMKVMQWIVASREE